jgi:VanZ family protein
MEKLFALFMKLSSPHIPVPLDKQAHFATGAIGGFIVTYFLGFIGGVSVITILAFAKEAYDAHNTGHTSDVWDWVATTLGGIIGSLVILIII